MKKYSVLFALLLGLALSSSSFAAPEKTQFGFGVIFGQPTGFVAKLWREQDRAIDFGLAYSFNGYTQVYADYLFHFPKAFAKSSSSLDPLTPYVGAGGIVSLSSSVALGVR